MRLEAVLQRRLQEASREIENYSQYDYILVNEKVEPAIDVLQSIVKSERLKRSPEPARAVDEQVLATAEMAERPEHDATGANDPGNVCIFPVRTLQGVNA